MADDNITSLASKGNNYDEAAEFGLRKLKSDKYREAIETISKLAPTAIRYLQSVQEFDWLEDDELAGKCASRFVEVAREIAKQCKVVADNGRTGGGDK